MPATRDLLLRFADEITDPVRRDCFLTRLPDHVETLALACIYAEVFDRATVGMRL